MSEGSVESVELNAATSFSRRPAPVPAGRRVAHRIALLCLILSSFNRQTASIDSLHMISWATRSRRSGQMLTSWWSGRRAIDSLTVRIDPNLAVTVNLAIVDGLVTFTGNTAAKRLTLTEAGRALVERIEADQNLLSVEKELLASLPRLSDAGVAGKLGIQA